MSGQDSERDLLWLALTPRDTVLVRDGRSFNAATPGTAQTVRPLPSTIAGAVAAAYGAKPGTMPDASPGLVPDEVRGPVLGLSTAGGWEPHFPVPADLVQEAEGSAPYAFRLAPANSEGQSDLSEQVMRWLIPPRHAGKLKPLAGWVPRRILAAYLSGELVQDAGLPVLDVEANDPFQPELRVGLARESSRQVRTGFLYAATHWRLDENWGFLAGCVLADGWDLVPAGPVPFGGRGRLADVEVVSKMSWPQRPAAFPGGRVLVYLATPAIWPDGWRIPVPEGAHLAGAATAEPEPVATMTPGQWATRALRWAVPAGSVYLLEFDDEARAAAWAADHHGTAYGRDPADRLRTAGFGVVLTGVWT